MILVEKTNADWWSIRKSSGDEGFVPANYVKETQPRIVKKKVQKRVKVPEKVKVKKTKTRREMVRTKKVRGKGASSRSSSCECSLIIVSRIIQIGIPTNICAQSLYIENKAFG